MRSSALCRSRRVSGLIRWADAAVLFVDVRSESRVDERAFVICQGCLPFFAQGDGDEAVKGFALELESIPIDRSWGASWRSLTDKARGLLASRQTERYLMIARVG